MYPFKIYNTYVYCHLIFDKGNGSVERIVITTSSTETTEIHMQKN